MTLSNFATKKSYLLREFTSPRFAELLASGAPVVALIPIGSVEPHGPHMSLLTDVVISEAACARAAELLDAVGLEPIIAPSISYGVTDYAAGFAGAISIDPEVLVNYLASVARGFLAAGCARVCLVSNHLEPSQDAAVRNAAAMIGPGVSVASPLTKTWARTLTAEFKSGACHAGQYETSIIMAAAPELIDENRRASLPPVPISLSKSIAAGINTFAAMGMHEAYAGNPAAATAAEGYDSIERLAEMVVGEVAAAGVAEQALTLESSAH